MSELHKKSGWSFGLLEIIALFFITGVLAAIIIPNLVPARATGGGLPSPCINNLRQVDAAANQFALEHHLTNGDRVNFPNDLTPYIKLNKDGKIPPCPSGGIYAIKQIGDSPTCSLGSTVTPAHVLP